MTDQDYGSDYGESVLARLITCTVSCGNPQWCKLYNITWCVSIAVCLSWKCFLPSGPKLIYLIFFFNSYFGPNGRKYFQLQQTSIDTHWAVSYNLHHWGLPQLTVQVLNTLTIVRAVVSVSCTYSSLAMKGKQHFPATVIYLASRPSLSNEFFKKKNSSAHYQENNYLFFVENYDLSPFVM